MNPYVGPRAFQQGERLFGRDQEVHELLDLLLAERIVLLHAPSGAGKTSLIQAALLPRLVEEGFRPFPVIRVNLSPPDTALPARHNRFVLSTLQCLEESQPPEERLPLEALAQLSLGDWWERRASPPAGSPVFIFDQLEELLTVDAPDLEAKAAFFQQVGGLLRDPECWALFAIREDYLGGLEPYTRALPTRLKTTFRLDLLREEAARLAIQEPARHTGREFTDEAARKLVDDLRRVHVQQPDGGMVEQLGPYVEPVQLQVVCRGLWQRMPADDLSIDPEDVEAVGNPDEALAHYYAEQVAVVATELGCSERTLREWFEHRLLLEGGLRGQVLREARESGGLGNRVVERLVRTHLVRAESWGSRLWYELAHDRLIKPIRRDNAAWFEQHLNLLQQQARLWNQKGRLPALLLRDEALKEGERWARQHPAELDALEREFLVRCQEACVQARRARRQRRWIGVLALAALLTSLAVLGLMASALRKGEAHTSDLFAAASLRNLERQPDLALLWPLTRLEQHETPRLRGSLMTALLRWPELTFFLQHGPHMVSSVAFSPDGKLLASGGADQRLILWNADFGIQLETLPHESNVVSMAFSPDGKLLAAATSNGDIVLWDLEHPGAIRRKARLPAHVGMATRVAFDGRGHLASGGMDGRIRRWDVETGRERGEPLELGTPVYTLSLSEDGRWLAAAGDTHRQLWNVVTRQPVVSRRPPLELEQERGGPVALLPGKPVLALGLGDGKVFLWDFQKDAFTRLPDEHQRAVYELAFSGEGDRLVSVSEDESLFIWNVEERSLTRSIYPPRAGRPLSASFRPHGQQLAWGDDAGIVTVWDLSAPARLSYDYRPASDPPVPSEPNTKWLVLSRQGNVLASTDGQSLFLRDPTTLNVVGAPLLTHSPEPLMALAISPDGELLAAARGTDILLWSTSQRRALGVLPREHQKPIWTLAFADANTLASGDDEGKVIVWDVARRAPRGPALEQSTGASLFSLAFSPDGRRLASGDARGLVMLWDVERLEALQPLQLDVFAIFSLAFSPDGRTLAAGSHDSLVILWDVASGRVPKVLPDHSGPVMALLFSPEGRSLFSAGGDRQIFLWDLEQWEPIGLPLVGHADPILSLAFQPGQQHLLSSDERGTLISWTLNLKDWRYFACTIVGRHLSEEDWGRVGARPPKPDLAARACPMGVLQEAHLEKLAGHEQEARRLYQQANALVTGQGEKRRVHYGLFNAICWFGATDGFATEVMESCEQAVAQSPKEERDFIKDTRGVARALAHDTRGAIEDLQDFVDWTEDNKRQLVRFGTREQGEEAVKKREHWIAELHAGLNPFDEETLKLLQRE
jgi:WD40 repeat protein